MAHFRPEDPQKALDESQANCEKLQEMNASLQQLNATLKHDHDHFRAKYEAVSSEYKRLQEQLPERNKQAQEELTRLREELSEVSTKYSELHLKTHPIGQMAPLGMEEEPELGSSQVEEFKRDRRADDDQVIPDAPITIKNALKMFDQLGVLNSDLKVFMETNQVCVPREGVEVTNRNPDRWVSATDPCIFYLQTSSLVQLLQAKEATTLYPTYRKLRILTLAKSKLKLENLEPSQFQFFLQSCFDFHPLVATQAQALCEALKQKPCTDEQRQRLQSAALLEDGWLRQAVATRLQLCASLPAGNQLAQGLEIMFKFLQYFVEDGWCTWAEFCIQKVECRRFIELLELSGQVPEWKAILEAIDWSLIAPISGTAVDFVEDRDKCRVIRPNCTHRQVWSKDELPRLCFFGCTQNKASAPSS